MWRKLLCSNAWSHRLRKETRWELELWCQTLMGLFRVFGRRIHITNQRVRGSDYTAELPHQFWRTSLYARPFNRFTERNQHLWRSRLNSWEHWAPCVRRSWPQGFHILEPTNTDKEVLQCFHNNYPTCQSNWPVSHWWQQHIGGQHQSRWHQQDQ